MCGAIVWDNYLKIEGKILSGPKSVDISGVIKHLNTSHSKLPM